MSFDTAIDVGSERITAAGSMIASFRTKALPLLALALLWELVAYVELFDPAFLPPLHEVVYTLYALLVHGELVAQTAITLQRGVLSYAAATLVSLPLGVLIGWKRTLYDYSEILVEILRPLPSVALIPVFILFFGPSRTTVQLIIFYPVFFLQLIATIYGTQSVDRTLIDSMRVMQMRDRRLFTDVFVPGSLPGIMTGLRQSLATMLTLAVVAEMLLANDGLGNYIMAAQRSFRIEEMYAVIVLIALLGYTLNKSFLVLQSRLLFWVERTPMD